jgi:exosortase/archaeosortase family protein
MSESRPTKKSRWNHQLALQMWIFILIMLFFQLGWEYFEAEITTWTPLVWFSNLLGNWVLQVTPAILNPVYDLNIYREDVSMVLPSGFYVGFFFHLSGIKQMVFVLFMMLLLPGPWRKKMWFTPICIVALFVSVFLRFLMLTLHCVTYPEHLHLIQDMLFGPLFYLEILFFWGVWVLLIAKTASLSNYPKNRDG